MKLWLTFMAGPGDEENLREMVEPVYRSFDGIVATFHTPADGGAAYLESRKGEGEIQYTKYVYRHDHSRNHYLFAGIMQEGDWACVYDSLERLNVEFAMSLPAFCKDMERLGINMVMYYGKPLLYRYHESLRYVGTPHESLIRGDGKARSIELSHQFPNESDIRLNVRPEKRDGPQPFYWVSHYLKYYVSQPWGSNAVLLGLDTYGDPAKLFPARDDLRLAFRQEIKRRGFPLTVEGVKQAFTAPLDDTLKSFINGEIVLNNFYRYTILGDKAVIHSHNPADIKPV